jgi:hypothetical protein
MPVMPPAAGLIVTCWASVGGTKPIAPSCPGLLRSPASDLIKLIYLVIIEIMLGRFL